MGEAARSEFYDLYLCYNRADQSFVFKLAAAVESETIDGLKASRHLKVFVDEWDIQPGENMVQRMNQGMLAARHVAALLSPEFLAAPWPTFEWTHITSEDPLNASGKLIPLLVRDLDLTGQRRIELVAPFRALKYIDFRRDADFHKSFLSLISRLRNLPPERGQRRPPVAGKSANVPVSESQVSWLPEKLPDVLLGNLLPITSLPTKICSATTVARRGEDVGALVERSEPSILRAGRLFAFANLASEEVGLYKAVEPSSVKWESRHEWLLDEDKTRNLMSLLNRCLASHLSGLAIRADRKGRFFFRPKSDGANRVWQNLGDPKREVAAKKTSSTAESSFWVHHAARIKFRRLGEKMFLMIEPTYLFTTDGETPLQGQSAGRLAMMWGGKQKNVEILRNFVFWAKTIARSEPQVRVQTGGEPIIVSAMPAIVRMSYGIAFDHVRVGSLLKQVDRDLDAAAEDVIVAESDEEGDDDAEGSES
jgi:TIR domain